MLSAILNKIRLVSGADPGGAPGAPPPEIGKNKIFWLKIVIFSHEIPQIFSLLPPLGAISLSAPPLA